MAGMEEEHETGMTVRKEDGAQRREGKERKSKEPCGSDSKSCDNLYPGLGLSPARHAPCRLSSHLQEVEEKLGNIQQRQSGSPLLFCWFPCQKEK